MIGAPWAQLLAPDRSLLRRDRLLLPIALMVMALKNVCLLMTPAKPITGTDGGRISVKPVYPFLLLGCTFPIAILPYISAYYFTPAKRNDYLDATSLFHWPIAKPEKRKCRRMLTA